MSDLIIMTGVALFVGGGISLMTSTLFRAHSRAWVVMGAGQFVALGGAVLMLAGAISKVVSA